MLHGADTQFRSFFLFFFFRIRFIDRNCSTRAVRGPIPPPEKLVVSAVTLTMAPTIPIRSSSLSRKLLFHLDWSSETTGCKRLYNAACTICIYIYIYLQQLQRDGGRKSLWPIYSDWLDISWRAKGPPPSTQISIQMAEARQLHDATRFMQIFFSSTCYIGQSIYIYIYIYIYRWWRGPGVCWFWPGAWAADVPAPEL